MTKCKLGWLWSRYFVARDALENGEMSWTERRNAQRELRGTRARLVVNYSSLVKYVAGRITTRADCSVELEDMLLYGVFGPLVDVGTYDPAAKPSWSRMRSR